MEKRVKDVMLSLNEYVVISEDATLLDAVIALEKSKITLSKNREPHRAVLVSDKNGKIVGKIGHLAFLKALEPKYTEMGDPNLLLKAGVSMDVMDKMKDSLCMWQDSLSDLCKRARKVKAKDAMRPVTESVDEDAPLTEAIHKFIIWQTLSLLVTRKKEVVGILRLVDVYAEVAAFIKKSDSKRVLISEEA